MKNWKPNSWRTKTGKHLPVYENENIIFERVKNKIKPGGIILLHDTSQKSVNVLERLLLFLKTENYSIVSVDKLLNLSAYEN